MQASASQPWPALKNFSYIFSRWDVVRLCIYWVVQNTEQHPFLIYAGIVYTICVLWSLGHFCLTSCPRPSHCWRNWEPYRNCDISPKSLIAKSSKNFMPSRMVLSNIVNSVLIGKEGLFLELLDIKTRYLTGKKTTLRHTDPGTGRTVTPGMHVCLPRRWAGWHCLGNNVTA